jgi:hypothetical protein
MGSPPCPSGPSLRKSAGSGKLLFSKHETENLKEKGTGNLRYRKEKAQPQNPGWVFHPGAFSYYHQEKFSVVTGLTMVTTSM